MQVSDTEYSGIRPIQWQHNCVRLLDQRLLPEKENYLDLVSSEQVTAAIRDMVVRGAPAIGITAAYGIVLAARDAFSQSGDGWRSQIEPDICDLADARPTAVNLHWAIKRMKNRFTDIDGDPLQVLLAEATAIHQEDIAANLAMGAVGASYLSGAHGVLTHCNAGSLATGGYGTALGVIRSAVGNTGLRDIYACETRPWLQGARLTLWELMKDNIPATLITDSAAALLMQSGSIDWVVVGADRITANGDVVNKIGTYGHAIAARHHDVRFMVAAPLSTIDLQTETGRDVTIELREDGEFYGFSSKVMTPSGAKIHNPVFDVTPAELVDVIVTEKGPVESPDREKIRALFAD